mgnify:CR=1 FL=1
MEKPPRGREEDGPRFLAEEINFIPTDDRFFGKAALAMGKWWRPENGDTAQNAGIRIEQIFSKEKKTVAWLPMLFTGA